MPDLTYPDHVEEPVRQSHPGKWCPVCRCAKPLIAFKRVDGPVYDILVQPECNACARKRPEGAHSHECKVCHTLKPRTEFIRKIRGKHPITYDSPVRGKDKKSVPNATCNSCAASQSPIVARLLDLQHKVEHAPLQLTEREFKVARRLNYIEPRLMAILSTKFAYSQRDKVTRQGIEQRRNKRILKDWQVPWLKAVTKLDDEIKRTAQRKHYLNNGALERADNARLCGLRKAAAFVEEYQEVCTNLRKYFKLQMRSPFTFEEEHTAVRSARDSSPLESVRSTLDAVQTLPMVPKSRLANRIRAVEAFDAARETKAEKRRALGEDTDGRGRRNDLTSTARTALTRRDKVMLPSSVWADYLSVETQYRLEALWRDVPVEIKASNFKHPPMLLNAADEHPLDPITRVKAKPRGRGASTQKEQA